MSLKELVKKLWKDETGQDLTEYALLLVFVALGTVSAVGSLATAIGQAFSSAALNLTT